MLPGRLTDEPSGQKKLKSFYGSRLRSVDVTGMSARNVPSIPLFTGGTTGKSLQWDMAGKSKPHPQP